MTTETIAIAVDHAGIKLKPAVIEEIRRSGREVIDLGTDSEESVDYPDFANKLVDEIRKGTASRGVLMCGTGIGISIAANRHRGIRAALCCDAENAALARQHNDANVLCMGARTTDEATARKILEIFLDTPFEGGRHARRVEKLG